MVQLEFKSMSARPDQPHLHPIPLQPLTVLSRPDQRVFGAPYCHWEVTASSELAARCSLIASRIALSSRIVNTWGFDMDDVKAVIQQTIDGMGAPPEASAEAPKPEMKKVRRAAKKVARKVGPKKKAAKKAKKSAKKSAKKAPKAKAKKKKAKKAKR